MTRSDLLMLSDGALALRRAGAATAEIADRLRVTAKQAVGLLAIGEGVGGLERSSDRPRWSYPDAELVRICRAARAEIEAAETLQRRKRRPR